jgi:N-acetylmuramoyl-L-alanine amidase
MFTHLFTYSGLESDLDEAIGRFREVGEKYPKHRLADDAQYRIGEIYYNQKEDPTQAYVEFLKVDIKYPDGDMRLKARAMLDKISVVLSKEDTGDEKKREPSTNAPRSRVKEIRHWSTPNYTRVVIDLDRPVKYTSHLLNADPSHKKPRRLYVDLKNARVPRSIDSVISIKDGLLQSARAGQNTLKTVRVVLDIESIGGYKIFHLYDPFRIVVDVRGTRQNGKTTKGSVRAARRRPRKGVWKSKTPDSKVSLARQLGLSVQRIVIDPGHGGKDPGTYLKGGIKEKNIVLNLAKVVAKKVEERLGCEAILTRKSDRFLSLENRTAFANMNKADLFVSLHINAHKQRQIHGLETYYLNMATDSRAVMVAARENATSEKNISDLQTILNDLMLNTKISESNRLAHEVQKGMVTSVRGKYRNVKSLGVKQAPFYVLIGAEMPAVLVETGFITNPTERKRLTSEKYLDVLGNGIVEGIDHYIKSIETSYVGG